MSPDQEANTWLRHKSGVEVRGDVVEASDAPAPDDADGGKRGPEPKATPDLNRAIREQIGLKKLRGL